MKLRIIKLIYDRLDQRKEGINDIVYADLTVFKNGKKLGSYEAQKVFYGNWEQPSSEVAIITSLKEDLYIVLSAWEDDGQGNVYCKSKSNDGLVMDWFFHDRDRFFIRGMEWKISKYYS